MSYFVMVAIVQAAQALWMVFIRSKLMLLAIYLICELLYKLYTVFVYCIYDRLFSLWSAYFAE